MIYQGNISIHRRTRQLAFFPRKTLPLVTQYPNLRCIIQELPDLTARAAKALPDELAPTLRQGARIVTNGHILPDPGTMSLIRERAVRDMDMIMLTLFNSREREEGDWIELFNKVDLRFSTPRLWTPEGATMGIIEVTWTGTMEA